MEFGGGFLAITEIYRGPKLNAFFVFQAPTLLFLYIEADDNVTCLAASSSHSSVLPFAHLPAGYTQEVCLRTGILIPQVIHNEAFVGL